MKNIFLICFLCLFGSCSNHVKSPFIDLSDGNIHLHYYRDGVFEIKGKNNTLEQMTAHFVWRYPGVQITRIEYHQSHTVSMRYYFLCKEPLPAKLQGEIEEARRK